MEQPTTSSPDAVAWLMFIVTLAICLVFIGYIAVKVVM